MWATGSALRGHNDTSNTVSWLQHRSQQPGMGPEGMQAAAACAFPLQTRISNRPLPTRAHRACSVLWRLLPFRAVGLYPALIMTGDSDSGSATTASASKDVLALSGVSAGATQGQLTSPSSQETDGPTSSTPAGATDFLSSIVGQYASTPRLACPESIVHAEKTWTAIDIGSKGWSKQDHAAGFFDTFEGGDKDQRGHFVVRCRVRALAGSTSTYVLRGGKSSNAWEHFDNFAASPQVSDLQRRRHAAVVAFRAKSARPSAASTRGKEGPIDGYLRAARTREMSASQARPHHL